MLASSASMKLESDPNRFGNPSRFIQVGNCSSGAQTDMLTTLLADICERDFVSLQRMRRRLRLPLSKLAKLANVHRNTLTQLPESQLD